MTGARARWMLWAALAGAFLGCTPGVEVRDTVAPAERKRVRGPAVPERDTGARGSLRRRAPSEPAAVELPTATNPVVPESQAASAVAARSVATQPATQPPAAKATEGPCPEGMVPVPGGTFMMGTKKGDPIAPLHKVTLTKPYCVDKLEATLDEYQECERAGACTKSGAPQPGLYGGGPNCTEKREGRGKHPINCITWLQAEAYCKFRGKRLLTEAEWEFAARGPKSLKFPWGNQPPTPELAWNSMYKPAPWGTSEVGKHPKGASPFGVLDMGGNVGEWVQDWRHRLPWTPLGHETDPEGALSGSFRVIKDIAWDGGIMTFTVAYRSGGRPDENVYDTVGVRCGRHSLP